MDSTAHSSSFISNRVSGGALGAFLVTRLAQASIVCLGASLIGGQLFRVALPGQGGGLLVSDVAVALVLVAAWCTYLRRPALALGTVRTLILSMLPFLGWSLFPLLLHTAPLTSDQLVIALLYWVRLCSYLLLIPALVLVGSVTGIRRPLVGAVWMAIIGVLATAIIQLWVVPDLGTITGGWDPHINRAVGSWLDPNFLGAFLALSLAFVCAQIATYKRVWMIAVLLVVVVIGLLTKSRSSLAMVVAMAGVLVPMLALFPPGQWRRYLPVLASLSVLALSLFGTAVLLLRERALGIFFFDPTVELRLQALRQVVALAADHWLFGVGYNAYQFAALNAGLIGDFAIHSRAGADNSILTLWVTTGLVGVMLFFFFLSVMCWQLLSRWRYRQDVAALAALIGVIGLVVHSQFVNSLLYGHLIIMLACLIALGLVKQPTDTMKRLQSERIKHNAVVRPQAQRRFPLLIRQLAEGGVSHPELVEGRDGVVLVNTPRDISQLWLPRVVALLVLLIPAYQVRFTLLAIPTNIWELLVVFVFSAGMLYPLIRHRWRALFVTLPLPIIVLCGLFSASAITSTLISAELQVSLGILKGWIVVPMCIGWLVYTVSSGVPRVAHLLFRVLIISGVITALISLTQYIPGQRLAGIYDVPNSLALWLAPLLTLTVWFWWSTAAAVRRRYILAGAAAVQLVALLATQSVGGVMSVIGALLIGAWLWSPFRRVVGLLLVVLLVGGAGWLFVSDSSQATFAVRQQLWSVSTELLGEHPLVGIGLGQFEPNYQRVLHQRFWLYEYPNQPERADYYPELAVPIREFVFRDPHNWVVSFWLNLGLVGLVSFAGLTIYAINKSFTSRGVAVALLALLLFGLVDTIYWKNDLAALQWVLLALALARRKDA